MLVSACTCVFEKVYEPHYLLIYFRPFTLDVLCICLPVSQIMWVILIHLDVTDALLHFIYSYIEQYKLYTICAHKKEDISIYSNQKSLIYIFSWQFKNFFMSHLYLIDKQTTTKLINARSRTFNLIFVSCCQSLKLVLQLLLL